MEKGILKKLPEALWQPEIDSISMQVQFTEFGSLDISTSHRFHLMWV